MTWSVAQQTAQTVDLTPVIVAVITAGATIVVALLGVGVQIYLSHRRVRRIDDAVNNVHPNEPKLIDRVCAMASRLDDHIEENGRDHDMFFEHIGVEPPERGPDVTS